MQVSKTDSKTSLDGSGGEMQDTAIQAGSSKLDRFRRWMRRPRTIVLGLCLVIAGVPAYLTWAQLARTVDARLRQGPLGNSVSIYAAPHTLTAGEAIEAAQVAAELQKRGYTESAANRRRALPDQWRSNRDSPGATIVFPRRTSPRFVPRWAYRQHRPDEWE